jgi:hypothetical protein
VCIGNPFGNQGRLLRISIVVSIPAGASMFDELFSYKLSGYPSVD